MHGCTQFVRLLVILADHVYMRPICLMSPRPRIYASPQIIARINSPNMRVRKSVHTLLLRVGKHHPQALIYPLAVASHEARSANALGEAGAGPADASSRGRWAERILQSMRAHCATLVEQALLVSNELIRCALVSIAPYSSSGAPS